MTALEVILAGITLVGAIFLVGFFALLFVTVVNYFTGDVW
jgi:hypothetical protein